MDPHGPWKIGRQAPKSTMEPPAYELRYARGQRKPPKHHAFVQERPSKAKPYRPGRARLSMEIRAAGLDELQLARRERDPCRRPQSRWGPASRIRLACGAEPPAVFPSDASPLL